MTKLGPYRRVIRRSPGGSVRKLPTRLQTSETTIVQNSQLNQRPVESLTPEKLQMFVAGLSALAPEEVRKAKVLYLRNAIAEFRALQASNEGFKATQGCFSIIPIFWPILKVQKKVLAAQLQLGKDRIHNAIDVWRDDLRGERFELDDEVIRV